MTPADMLRPYLLEADRRKPRLRHDNRFPSCFELLEDTLLLANAAAVAAGRPPEWQFIGKSSAMDGGMFRPSWFQPRNVPCARPDGQVQNVLIDGLSMDAAWYLPTLTQVKVITNSTANEPGPHEHGPAGLNSYDIPLHNPDTGNLQYRWHNPPMPMRDGVVVTPMPTPGPAPTPAPTGGTALGPGEMMEAAQWLDEYYAHKDGLQRPLGLSIGGRPDWEGLGAWLFGQYIPARLAGQSIAQARVTTMKAIRQSGGPNGEWQVKHPGETP